MIMNITIPAIPPPLRPAESDCVVLSVNSEGPVLPVSSVDSVLSVRSEGPVLSVNSVLSMSSEDAPVSGDVVVAPPAALRVVADVVSA